MKNEKMLDKMFQPDRARYLKYLVISYFYFKKIKNKKNRRYFSIFQLNVLKKMKKFWIRKTYTWTKENNISDSVLLYKN